MVDGRIYSFGLGSEGQLGTGKRQNELMPVAIEQPVAADSVFAGSDVSFFVSQRVSLKLTKAENQKLHI